MTRPKHKSVTLSPELNELIANLVATGVYANASEVMRAALRSLEREHLRHELSLQQIHTASVRDDLAEFLEASACAVERRADHRLAAELRASAAQIRRPLRRTAEHF